MVLYNELYLTISSLLLTTADGFSSLIFSYNHEIKRVGIKIHTTILDLFGSDTFNGLLKLQTVCS